MPSAHYCAYCKARIPTVDRIVKHYTCKKACGKKYYEQIAHSAITVWDDELESNLPENDASSTSSSLAAAADGGDQFENDTLEAINVGTSQLIFNHHKPALYLPMIWIPPNQSLNEPELRRLKMKMPLKLDVTRKTIQGKQLTSLGRLRQNLSVCTQTRPRKELTPILHLQIVKNGSWSDG